VADNAPARARHQRFLVSRLATGAVMMVGLPPYLLWRGVPSGFEVLAIASLLLPVFAAVLLARTGSLWIAHAVSSAGLTGLVVALAGVTGGAASPAAVWLVAIPLEALVSGSLRATIAASVMAVLGVLTVVALGAWAGALPVMDISAGIALPAFAITAIGHVAAQALEHMRNEGVWRERLRDNEAREAVVDQGGQDFLNGQGWHASRWIRFAHPSRLRFDFERLPDGRRAGLNECCGTCPIDRDAFREVTSRLRTSFIHHRAEKLGSVEARLRKSVECFRLISSGGIVS
jgi:cell cycle sensor histidine kinase DivJ